jgi:serine/threonine protein phosphatase 1
VKRFAIGDIHGNYRGLLQALERAGVNYNEDLVISLGDIADGHTEVPQCIEELKKIKNFIWILGNHDEWTQNWFNGKTDMRNVGRDGYYIPQGGWDQGGISHNADMWLSQGGRNTYTAYVKEPHLITEHRDFWLKKPQLYLVLDRQYVTKENGEVIRDDDGETQMTGGKCFVHGGFNRDYSIYYQSKKSPHVLYWDRSLWSKALSIKDSDMTLLTEDNFDEIFIGHTSTEYWGTQFPMNSGGVWNLDTGAGYAGKVTIMDIDSKKYWQSDANTYPETKKTRG